MTTLLHIDSSILGEMSVTRQLTADVVQQKKAKHPGLHVIYRDLALHAPEYLTAEQMALLSKPASQDSSHHDLKHAQTYIDEVLKATTIVVGAPMYNFSVPSQLKSWIDHILVAGKTFRYTANGPEPLIPHGKQVIIVSSRGGVYSEGVGVALDHQESYLRTALGFIGLKDVVIVRAEGVSQGDHSKLQAIQAAQKVIKQLS